MTWFVADQDPVPGRLARRPQMPCANARRLLYLSDVMLSGSQEVKPGLKAFRLTPILLLFVALALCAFSQVLQAKEGTLLIFSSADTRSELAPCG